MGEIPAPHEVLAFLDKAAGELDALGKEQESAYLNLGDAETEYQEKLDEALIELAEEYEAKEKRLPGEDVRLARARKRIDFAVYTRYRKAKRHAEGLDRHAKLLGTAVTARQSTLRGIREGMSTEGLGNTGETFGRRQ